MPFKMCLLFNKTWKSVYNMTIPRKKQSKWILLYNILGHFGCEFSSVGCIAVYYFTELDILC